VLRQPLKILHQVLCRYIIQWDPNRVSDADNYLNSKFRITFELNIRMTGNTLFYACSWFINNAQSFVCGR